MNKSEHWVAVDGEPFLEVSSHGRVRTLDRPMAVAARDGSGKSMGNFRPVAKGKIIATWVNTTGYLVFTRKVDGVKRRHTVHRLIAKAFVPGFFEGGTVDHIDGNKLNNAAENLEWVTLAENSRRQNVDGRGAQFGDKHHGAKLKEAQIPEIFAMRATGASYQQIGNAFRVSGSLIHKIVTGLRRSGRPAWG